MLSHAQADHLALKELDHLEAHYKDILTRSETIQDKETYDDLMAFFEVRVNELLTQYRHILMRSQK